jgi:ribonuclease HI
MKNWVIFVDASCIGNPWPMEYRIITGDIIHKWQNILVKKSSLQEIYRSELFPVWTNNIGEFLAIIDAIKYVKNMKQAVSSQQQGIIIYTDSKTALHRLASKKPKTTLSYNNQTKSLLTKLQESIIRLKNTDISWYNIEKRETQLRGEIPADFGRK